MKKKLLMAPVNDERLGCDSSRSFAGLLLAMGG
jgi:hypothetical protein